MRRCVLQLDFMNANSVLNQQVKSSVVNGTNDREAYPKRWIALLVQMNTEMKVGAKLNEIKIENYVPTQIEIHQWSDRKKKINRIIIPMIVFVKVSEVQEKRLKTYSYIRKIISYPGQNKSAIIPDEQIERLKFMLNYADSKVEINNNIFEIGEKVKIIRGSLNGLEGELYYFDSDKPMVAIRIECLGYACVNVSKTDIISINNKI